MKTDANKRKPRVDSTAERIRIMSGATRQISPPSNVPLDAEELPFFASIIAEFAKADWSAHQLEMAAMLAMSMAANVREMRFLQDEGATTPGAMGGTVTNPRKTVVQMHQSAIVSFRRSLALHAAAHGDRADIGKTKTLAKRIEAESPFDDDLIARPN